jgi:hypothetical protein
VATLEPEVIGLAVEDPEEVTEKWVEIRSLDDDSIVTWIEVLSPRNKRGTGRQRYLAKRASLIERPVHIVEVDLLLCGRPLPMQRSLPEQRLYAFVSRAERRPQSEVYSWDLRDRLPAVPVPLRQPDPDVLLDLAAAYNSAYKDGRWTHFLRRQGQLEPQLSQADLEWGRTILGTGGETGTR